MKYDYISILAGGSCKFKCDFCIGNKIREDKTPSYSEKWNSFLECYADLTDLLSVSGDTSDPSFVSDTSKIPSVAKGFNPDIKVSVHTRNTDTKILEKYLEAGYYKIVVSIDEGFFDYLHDEDTLWFRRTAREKKLRFSIVLSAANFGYFCGKNNILDKITETFPGVQITLRPNVFEDNFWIESFGEMLGEWGYNTNGSEYLEENPNIWFWNFTNTNPNINALYLFRDGIIAPNCRWDKITKDGHNE